MREKKRKLVDNRPVLESLRALGYTRYAELGTGVRDAFRITRDDGNSTRVKFQKRNGSERARGQHRFGVSHLNFDRVDSFVFWIQGLDHLLMVPTDQLKAIFQENAVSNVYTKSQQWEVVFHFDGDHAFMEPIGTGVMYSMSEHLHRWKQSQS